MMWPQFGHSHKSNFELKGITLVETHFTVFLFYFFLHLSPFELPARLLFPATESIVFKVQHCRGKYKDQGR